MGLGLGLALGLALGFGLGFGLGSGFGFGCRHAPMAALKQWWEGGTSRGMEWKSSRAWVGGRGRGRGRGRGLLHNP